MTKGKGAKFRRDVSVGGGRRVSVYAETKRLLELKVAKLRLEAESGTLVHSQKATVTELADKWLPFHVAEKELAESTELSYSTILRKHIKPLLGMMRVQQLTEHIITQKLAHRSHLSSSTRRKICLTLHLVIKYAKRQGVISKDPMEFISLPTQRNETDREMNCMNVSQAREFIAACDGARLENLFIISLATGAREGELLSVRVTDFVDDYKVMRIRRTLSDDREGNPRIKDQPKTSASRRNVPLPEIARTAVLSELSRRITEGRQDHDLLFSTSKDTFHLRQNVLSRHFRPIIRRAMLAPSMAIHDLRHTYATLALNAGVGVHLVSKMLGHASVKITIDLYSHALPDATAEAAAIVHSALTNGMPRAQTAG